MYFELNCIQKCLRERIDMLENVQHRATRLEPDLKKDIEVRLKALTLTILEIRRKREDWNFIKF